MSLKERSYVQIEKDEMKQEALETLSQCADDFLMANPIYQAGEYYNRDRKLKEEVFQKLVKEMHKGYVGKCDLPEIRFSVFNNGLCTMHVFDKDRIDSKGRIKAGY